MPISPSLRGLSQAVSGPLSSDDLMQQFDQGQQARYATEDQQLAADPLAGTPGHASRQAMQFNRMQDASAVGPQGYNRQQVPFIQDVASKRVRGPGSQSDFGQGPQEGPFGPFGAGTGGNVPTTADQEGPFGPFGMGTGGNMPTGTPELAGLHAALISKKGTGR